MTNAALITLLSGVFAAQGLKSPDVAARKIVEDFERRELAQARRDENIYTLCSVGGMTALAIGERFGLTPRHIERIISEQHSLRREIA